MPALTKQTEDLRIAQAVEAVRLMAMGVKKADACERAGLTIRQFDFWMAKDNGAIEALQKAIIQSERVRLADLENAQAILLRKLIENVTQPGIPIILQLKALKYIDKLKGELEEKLGVHTEEDAAETYLMMKGPVTRVEASMMIKTSLTSAGNPSSPMK
jgi:hypothetical protein